MDPYIGRYCYLVYNLDTRVNTVFKDIRATFIVNNDNINNKNQQVL